MDYPAEPWDYLVLLFELTLPANDARESAFVAVLVLLTFVWANSTSQYTFTGVSLLQPLKSSAVSFIS